MSTYKHGGDITTFAKKANCKISEIIDLSSNINFVKPHIDIDFNTLEIAPYPNYDILERAIAKLYSIQKDELELFNGATSAIYTLFQKLNIKDITLYSPCYLEYKKSAQINNYNIEIINRFKETKQEIKRDSLVVFVNPSTPDGKFYKLEEFMKIWIEKNCTILIDESFLEFTNFESATKYINRYHKLYILKSMTKFYSSAGIRVGAILSNKKNIESIKTKEPLWKISEFDSHYLQAALRDKSFNEKSKFLNKKNRELLMKVLERFDFIENIYPSTANYLLIKLKGIDADTFQERLIAHKIMVRNCYNFDGLNNNYVRVAVKDILTIKRLEKALISI